ncbi:hypothetical protein [Candidatus Tisiphia endosymbiont of Nemotelus uliginosus]|uniref:hypothetical protein n=1 Tax=Candidatus Tisiphia endosymbiont of Nemotelus uliginosus TaxID=3077926 RepID=UPI0035C91B68
METATPWNKQIPQRESAIPVIRQICNQWLSGNLVAQDIQYTIYTFDLLRWSWSTEELLPYGWRALSPGLQDLIFSIIEGIFADEEDREGLGFKQSGDKAILELLASAEYQGELRAFAEKILIHLTKYLQEYKKEAMQRGYCRGLLEELGE